MNDKRLYQVIKGSHTTEKSVRVADKNRQITFKVAMDATKTEIKEGIEKLFNVSVVSVRTVTNKGKKKAFKQRLGERSDQKKAYVSLAEGHDINLANFQ